MKNIFTNHYEEIINTDGLVYYFGKVLTAEASNHYLHTLLKTIAWKNDKAIIFGKHLVTKRKAAWYGDKPFRYTYSNVTKEALTWTKELLELKILVEQIADHSFNACLLNLYNSGSEGMAWHSDDEKALQKNAAIASLSLGAERKFSFKHKTEKITRSLFLQHGSLLLMCGATQRNWLHTLPKSAKIKEPRINLTFRSMA